MKVFIVDWDLPTEPAWKRVYFYKKLRKLRAKHGLEGAMSTQSVLVVKDEQLAWDVHRLAKDYGKSNIYRAEKLNGA